VNAAIYDDIGEKQQALDSLNQALIVARKHADRYDEATSLNSMGVLLESLGEREKSLGAFNQATLLYHAMGRRDREAVTLTNSGAIYRDLGDRQQAINNYTKSLQMFRQIGDRDGEATTLSNIGAAKSNWGEKLQALDLYNQASAIQSQIGDRHGEAVSLNNIGLVNNELGFRQSAMGYFNLALADARALSNPLLEATVYGNLMSMNRDQQPAFSIFCGKQAVNMLQLLRGNIQRLDKQLQNDFLASNTGYYHDLADLLISQGRLPEAQQVLDLLKEQEYSDFVRGEKENTLGTLSLTPTEQQAESDYAKSSSQLVALGQQWSDLKKIKQRTPEQEQQYQQFSAQLDKANQSFADYLTHLYEVFGKNGSANKETADIKGQSKSLQQAIAKMPKTVALYTMAGEDKYRIIVITGSTMAAREYDIKAADLNKKVAAYLEVLHDPTKDPKPLALELYKILIGPVQSDLDQAQAATLVISLDGTLRYIPIEALYDGKKYMLEQYGIVTFTPASIPFLNDKPDISNLSAAALGISRQYEDDLNPLPSVEGELNDIVRDSSTKGANGVLPGSILLNSGFTETALEQQLDEQHPVVHIASHFVLKPGDDTQSYLLLSGKDKAGTGYHLTVADFRDNPKLSLSDTTLLTLSACETGVTSNASNGREVDGLAMTAQLKGAKSVISSLWPVNDSSTGLLMADFYKRWAEGGGSVMKVEALRQAQLDLLTGKIKPTPDLSDPNAPTSFVHPYYWAPFVLMGNWK
jgi:CHAT domain-containing protein